MQSVSYRLTEFFIIFILIPILFTFSFSIWVKMGIGFIGFVYIIYVLLRVEKLKFSIAPNLKWKEFWKRTFLTLSLITVITTTFVYVTDKDSLFNVLLNKPQLWLFILFVYSFFSVYPQELIYRTFFFSRYQKLFKNQNLFILISATIFSLGHIFFKSTLVLVFTFLGGLIFALTFHRTKSTLLVSIEHAIYGSWLFTVGMGNMLGFPS
ncbi:CPBP family intramembrane glutamic endopeptidase [Flavobacteriaceae sp. LMIT009]